MIEKLPETVYLAEGIVYLEELPACRVILQMVGKRVDKDGADGTDFRTPFTTRYTFFTGLGFKNL